MGAPPHITFDVDCPPRHAFAVWTSQIGSWWPPDHTVTGGPDEIVLESRPRPDLRDVRRHEARVGEVTV